MSLWFLFGQYLYMQFHMTFNVYQGSLEHAGIKIILLLQVWTTMLKEHLQFAKTTKMVSKQFVSSFVVFIAGGCMNEHMLFPSFHTSKPRSLIDCFNYLFQSLWLMKKIQHFCLLIVFNIFELLPFLQMQTAFNKSEVLYPTKSTARAWLLFSAGSSVNVFACYRKSELDLLLMCLLVTESQSWIYC